jgi:hypothetical protein
VDTVRWWCTVDRRRRAAVGSPELSVSGATKGETSPRGLLQDEVAEGNLTVDFNVSEAT